MGVSQTGVGLSGMVIGVSQKTGLVFIGVVSISASEMEMGVGNVGTAGIAIEASGKLEVVDIALAECATEDASVVSFWDVGTVGIATEDASVVSFWDVGTVGIATEDASVVSFWDVGTERNGCVQSSGKPTNKVDVVTRSPSHSKGKPPVLSKKFSVDLSQSPSNNAPQTRKSKNRY